VTPDNRVRVKEAHQHRGVVAEVQEPTAGPMAGIWIKLDDGTGPVLYLASELESEAKPCDCLWCAPLVVCAP
jgi:hypothetical protein